MKVLHIGKYFAPFKGGVETYMLDALGALSAEGVPCAALVHDHNKSAQTVKEQYGSGQSSFTVWRAGTWFKAWFTPVSPGFRGALKRLINEFKPDVIHAHLPNPSACWLLSVAQARSIPLVIHWHSDVVTDDQGPVMRLLYRLYHPLEQRLLQRAATIVATSRSYLESSESLADFPDKCRVVPLGLDPDRIGQRLVSQQETHREKQGPFQILAVGRLTYYKGFGFLLRAMADLDHAQLHIVGTGGLRKELRKLAKALKIGSRVHFHGGLDDEDLARLFHQCHCVCLPSIERTEAFGLVLLEAMAFSKPTVSSDVQGSGMGWVVENDVTGIKVPPRDVRALSSALNQLQKDPALATRLGQAGRERFDEHFAIGPSVKALKEIYHEVSTGEVA